MKLKLIIYKITDMKTLEEKAFEYCKKEICPTCSDNETCIKTHIIGECTPTYMEYAAFIAGYKAAQKWISVEDELPPEHKFRISKDVLTIAGSKHGVKNYDHITKQWSGSQNITITHWRPINND